ncbi:zinc ribbon domain-containing protein [Myxococcus stipitatus]|uniref:zinc ribbon domain-containing protein n=1 Tax=Myxococcus stipitatus TaxID=83455 RepID=UPI0030CEB2FC
MPTEVLVMCPACGHPQPAGGARCSACGASLPEAPVPAPTGPFVSVDLGAGHSLVGENGRLTYQMPHGVPPSVVDLAQLRALTLESRPFFEALLLTAFGVLGVVASGLALKLVAFALAGLGVLLAAVCRVHALVLEVSSGASVRWSLGLARRGSERDARLLEGWRALALSLRARDVVVRDADGAAPIPPQSEPPEGPRA